MVLKSNKQLFINLLSHKLEQAGCVISHAQQDADLLIVRTEVQSADTILVGDVTDLLILLIYHLICKQNKYFRHLKPKQIPKRTEYEILNNCSMILESMRVTIFCLSMQYLVVMLYHVYMDLVKELL